MELPEHLGGHCGITHVDHFILQHFKEHGLKTFLDIGCGPGGMLDAALDLGYEAIGIDGDFSVTRNNPENVIIHDYTLGPASLPDRVFDLVWSCEFVEHVEEEYIENYMQSFLAGNLVCMTYAPENTPGHHHVNCKNEDYWKNIFQSYNFNFDLSLTLFLRKHSSMKRNFFRKYGLIFFK